MTGASEQKSDIEAFWDTKAPTWGALAQDSESFYSRRSRWVADLVTHHVPGGRSLDVGCGSGRLCHELARRHFDVYGLDISANMIAETVALMAPIVEEADTRFIVSSGADSVGFGLEFDVITAIGVFPYVEDYDEYIELLSPQLAPGGILVASCTNRVSLYTAYLILEHLFRFRWHRGWVAVLKNLMRTGVWSGGYVDYHRSRQHYSSASFDECLRRHGFHLMDAIDLFHAGGRVLDRRPQRRGIIGSYVARCLGWNHIGVYRAQLRRPTAAD